MQLQPQVITPAKGVVSHDAAKKTLFAEISELGLRVLDRLYDDACDVGFAFRSHKTGTVTRWAMIDEVRCPREDEVLRWVFIPCSESVRQTPQLAGYVFTVVND